MKCPICELDLTHSMHVFGMERSAFKEFHLRVAHYNNLIQDCYGLLSAMKFEYRELGHKDMPFGRRASELFDSIKEIQEAEYSEWEGEK